MCRARGDREWNSALESVRVLVYCEDEAQWKKINSDVGLVMLNRVGYDG
jgi:hypothetical protein